MRRFNFKLFYMHVKHVMQLKPKLKIFFSLIVAFVLVLYGCQKELSNDGTDLYERFYKLPKDASSSLTDMASSIRKLENQLDIAHRVVAHNSLPIWSNSLFIDSKDAVNTSSANSRGAIQTGTGSFRTVITAVADIATNEITGYIKFMRANDTVRVRYVEKSMAINKYQMASNKPEKDKAIQDLFFFAYFEKELNQVEKLKLKNITITANSAGSSIDALMQACITRLCHSWGYNYFDNNGTLIAVSGWECYYVSNSCGGGGGGGGVSYQNCGSGGPCPGSGGYGGGSGGWLTGGSGSNGSNYWGPPIYSTQEGGGNGNGSPRDSLIRDSTIKKRLHDDAVAMKDSSDKAWNLGFTNNVEYGFWGIDSQGVSKVGSKVITSNLENEVKIEKFKPTGQSAFVNAGGKLRFDYHIHQNLNVADRHMQDPVDLTTLNKRLGEDAVTDYFVTYVDIGTKLYAIVVEDKAKAKLFFNQHSSNMTTENMAAVNVYYSGTANDLNNYMLNDLIKNSSISGLGVYVTNNPGKNNFIKLN
jgi:hypothetical protein